MTPTLELFRLSGDSGCGPGGLELYSPYQIAPSTTGLGRRGGGGAPVCNVGGMKTLMLKDANVIKYIHNEGSLTQFISISNSSVQSK